MYLTEAPLGSFRLGESNPTQAGPIVLPPPTLESTLRGVREDFATVTILVDGKPELELPVLPGGTVTMDDERHPRRTVSLNLAPLTDWIPKDAKALLDPRAGAIIKVTAQVKSPRSETIWSFPMGTFPVIEPNITHGREGLEISLASPDLSHRVNNIRTKEPMRIANGTSIEAAIGQVLSRIAPWLPLNLPATGETLPATDVGGLTENQGLWAVCVDWAKSAGFELYVDVNGVAVLRPKVKSFEVSQATWDNSLSIGVDRKLDATEAIDSLRMSYTGGVLCYPDVPFGRFADYDGTTDSITTPQQALKALVAQWETRRGLVETVSGEVLADYRREGGDIIFVRDEASGTDMASRLISASWTLGSPTMRFSLAQRNRY